MNIRKYRSDDCRKIATLFYDTVHHVNSKDYTQKQLHAWATGLVDMNAWDRSFTENYTVVCEQGKQIIGFGDIDNTGYLNRIFVHKEYQGLGIATAIVDYLEEYAMDNGLVLITTHASITARPFFERRGYIVMKEQQVKRNKQWLTNFVMEKSVIQNKDTMLMHPYDTILRKWKDILKKVTSFGGKARVLIIEPCATPQDIEMKEKSLGLSLPASFKELLLHFSRHVEFRWFLPDNANLPHEFREIFSGEIGWNIDELEDLTEFGLAMESDGIDSGLKNKLCFYHVGNGDVLAFDMASRVEPKVVYWDHEEDGVLCLAESFLSYVNKMTDLYGVGSEIWQLEPFLDENGINTTGGRAVKWRHWFNTFASMSFDVVKSDLDSLIQYIEYHGELRKQDLDALASYDKEFIFKKVQDRLQIVDECQKEILYQIIGEHLGLFASEWVKSLWTNDIIKPEYRSYLTAKCLPLEEGLSLVTTYVESLFIEKVSCYEAKKHLGCFKNNQIIQWLKEYISSTTTKDQWHDLFACSNPTWEDIQEWFMLGAKYRMVAIHALKYMVDSWSVTYIKGNYKICSPPAIQEVISFLKQERENEILNSKKRVFDEIIQNIELII